MMDTGGGDQSFSFYQDVFKFEFLSGLDFSFLKAARFLPIGTNDSQGFDPILLLYKKHEQNTVWESHYWNAALSAVTPFDSEVQAASIFVDLNLQRGFTVLITGKEAPPSRRVVFCCCWEGSCIVRNILKRRKDVKWYLIWKINLLLLQQRAFFKHFPAPNVKFRKGWGSSLAHLQSRCQS